MRLFVDKSVEFFARASKPRRGRPDGNFLELRNFWNSELLNLGEHEHASELLREASEKFVEQGPRPFELHSTVGLLRRSLEGGALVRRGIASQPGRRSACIRRNSERDAVEKTPLASKNDGVEFPHGDHENLLGSVVRVGAGKPHSPELTPNKVEMFVHQSAKALVRAPRIRRQPILERRARVSHVSMMSGPSLLDHGSRSSTPNEADTPNRAPA